MGNTVYDMNNIMVQLCISITTTKECVHITDFIYHKFFDINTCVSF